MPPTCQRHASLSCRFCQREGGSGFFECRFGDPGENSLGSFESIEANRVTKRPDLRRIIVAVDSSRTKGDDDGADEISIVVVGSWLTQRPFLEDARLVALGTDRNIPRVATSSGRQSSRLGWREKLPTS